jgi:hypothetical protein
MRFWNPTVCSEAQKTKASFLRKQWGTPCLVEETKPGDWPGHPPDQQPWICVFPARLAFHRRNPGIIQAQIKPPDQFPDQSRTVIVFNQFLNIHGSKNHLLPIDRSQTRRS